MSDRTGQSNNGGRAFVCTVLSVALSGCGADDPPDPPKKPPQTATVTPDGKPQPDEEPVPRDALTEVRGFLAAADAAIAKPDIRRFLELALPLPELRRLREQQSLDAAVAALEADESRRTRLREAFGRWLQAQPVLHASGDLATVTVTTVVTEEPLAELRALADPDAQTPPSATGFADDLPTALRLAADALDGGAWPVFVEKTYPPSDLSDYASGRRGLETVQLLERHPAMVRQMATDLRRLAEAEYELSSDGTVATFPSEARPVKFQKVAGTWRFFDDSRPLRKAAFEQSRRVLPGTENVVKLERVGDGWRIYELPPSLLELVLPRGDQ